MSSAPAARGQHATLASVAERAGVSRQTVSNVLHTPEVVQPKTRQRVRKAIAELNYRPNLAARQMRTSRSQAVAVRIQPSGDGVSAVVLDRFMHALCSAAQEKSYHLVVFTAADDRAEIAMYEHLLSTLAIDGFVVVGTHAGDARLGWLADHDVPFVCFGRPWRTDEGQAGEVADCSWVDVDGAAGTEQATRALVAAGHSRIAFFGWDESVGVGDDRERGWRRALSAAGHQPAVLLRGTDAMGSGAAMVDTLRDVHSDVTAAVCVSDSIAIGAAQRSAQLEHSLAVVGFDNTGTTQALDLSSVAQPLEQAAAQCFALLHEDLTGPAESRTARQVLLEPTLVLRTLNHPAVHNPAPPHNTEGP